MTAKSARKDLFRVDGPMVHPRLRRWQKMCSSGYLLDLEVYRKWDGLTFSPAKIFVTVKQVSTDPGVIEELLWDDEINQGLVNLGVKARDRDNEVIRYTLALKSAFEPVSLRHGQDWLKSLLVEFLREHDVASDLIEVSQLGTVLKAIRIDRTYRGAARTQALEAIEAIVQAKAVELTARLKYSRKVAINVLARALAQYLDEIFHISTRQFWFPGDSR